MKLEKIVTASFFISVILTVIGVYMKITHSQAAVTWLLACIIASSAFIITASYEVITSKKIKNAEKVMWVFAFCTCNSIAGLIYILIGQKRINKVAV